MCRFCSAFRLLSTRQKVQGGTRMNKPLFLAVFVVIAACGTNQSSAKVTAQGGTIRVDRLTLSIPPQAVDDSVTITVKEVEARHGEREFQIEPSELELHQEAELHVEAEGSEDLEVHRVEGEHTERLEHQRDDRSGAHHSMRCGVTRLGTFSVRRHDDSADAGDDHAGHGEGEADAGDDRGGHGEVDAGDDHGGLGEVDAGDDHGGHGEADAGTDGGSDGHHGGR